jgi:hypothetical protein
MQTFNLWTALSLEGLGVQLATHQSYHRPKAYRTLGYLTTVVAESSVSFWQADW